MKYALSLLLVLVASTSVAAPQNNVCVPRATGVPTREGPPKWVDWTGSGPIAADPNLDDPRWLGATGHTFALGGAKAPLLSRALFSVQGGQEYLYLSFIVDLDGFDTNPAHPSVATARDLFVGFHRPSPSPGSTELGYMLQFHLTGTGTGVTIPTFCSSYNTCDESSSTPHDFWRLFADKGHSGNSVCSGLDGRLYEPVPGSPPITWMTTSGGTQDAVRFWKVSSSDPSPLLQNRWAVQVRIPIIAPVAGTTSPILTGVERGSTFFYEATAKLAGPGNGPYAKVGWFPLTLTTSVCPDNNTDTIVHEELGDAGGGCSACDPTKFSKLSDLTGTPPTDCDGGLDIDSDHIGVLFNTPIPADPETIHPSSTFGAHDTTTPNHVIALPRNTKPVPAGGGTSNDVVAPIQGRFRLAGWGSAPWSSSTDTGKWKDIRGAASGICATPPTGSETCGNTTVAPGKHALITFDWTIGNDTGGIGSSEYCEFGLTPPGGVETCSSGCSCTDPADCAAGTGVRSSKAGGGFWPCVPSIYQFDQCMLVELNSPNGAATFVHQSIWNNMSFAQMSTAVHEALIDGRQLPTAPGQKYQDIYFIVMPRNMPASVPSTTTAVSLAQNAALASAARIARPYIEDIERNPPDVIGALVKKLDHPALAIRVPENDDRVRKIIRARQIMAKEDLARVDALLGIAVNQGQSDKPSATLVQNAVKTLGYASAAEVVPTLEFYPYYQKFGKGRAYDPMTSFTVFLSHEGTLAGMHYEIDGAERVGDNIYHLKIPVGFARKIQIRAQAVVGNEAPLPRGNAAWPCGICCTNQRCGLVASLGNSLPGVVAGVFVIRRRRRRDRKS